MIMAWLKSFQTARFEGDTDYVLKVEDDMKPALCCAGFLVDLPGEFLLDTSALEKAASRHHGKQWERSTESLKLNYIESEKWKLQRLQNPTIGRGRWRFSGFLKGKSILGHIEESMDDDALRENEVPFEDAVFENVPTGQEVNDNGKEVNEVHFGVDESLEKINNTKINDEIFENFVVDTEPLSMTQILNKPNVMTQLEIESHNVISKQSGKPCSPIHSLVVGESSKQKVIENETEEFYKEAIEACNIISNLRLLDPNCALDQAFTTPNATIPVVNSTLTTPNATIPSSNRVNDSGLYDSLWSN
ncbi:hypothetical protein L2E82_06051 [Cichorium intybus]|uniref:Uncharacterized protein n=1 Tax=Cichorium intybus TaxID=13427 RepID=A0ACB9H8W5_CICIN|nr:hypothetical protein L2E82_06051 [Cichorium intybus]